MMLPYVELGNLQSSKILVFVAGFPDDCISGWKPILDKLSQENEYRLICMCFPGFDDSKTLPSWAYNFSEIVKMMHSTIEFLIPDPNVKYHLVLHDWGSLLGQLYLKEYPDKIDKLVMFDVAAMSKKLNDVIISITYQWLFAWTYITSQIFGLTCGNMALIFSLMFLRTFYFLSPTSHTEKAPRKREEVNAFQCYPYYYLWRNIFLGIPVELHFPSKPVLFMVRTEL